jgi:hypothetical protein
MRQHQCGAGSQLARVTRRGDLSLGVSDLAFGHEPGPCRTTIF